MLRNKKNLNANIHRHFRNAEKCNSGGVAELGYFENEYVNLNDVILQLMENVIMGPTGF